jgi:hypothetical protein
MFDTVASDIRIGPLLKNMNKQYIGNDFGTKGVSTDKLTPEMVSLSFSLLNQYFHIIKHIFFAMGFRLMLLQKVVCLCA